MVQTLDYFNITRGNVWGLQPVSHVGVIASTDLSEIHGSQVGTMGTDDSKDKYGMIDVVLTWAPAETLATTTPRSAASVWMRPAPEAIEIPPPGMASRHLAVAQGLT